MEAAWAKKSVHERPKMQSDCHPQAPLAELVISTSCSRADNIFRVFHHDT